MASTKREKRRNERHSAAWGKRVTMMLLLLVVGIAFAEDSGGSSRIAPELAATLAKARQGSNTNQTLNVIVQFKQVPAASQYAKMLGRGAKLHSKLHMVKAAAFAIPASALAALADDDDIAFVTLDHPLKGMDDYTDAAMNVSTVWNSGYNGSGIGVAVIDSGINDNHPDLWDSTGSYSRVVYRQDFTGASPYTNGHYVFDTYGHGTHVAGIIGGNGYKSAGRYAGVAPSVNLIDLRVLDGNGAGTDSMVVAAIQQAIALKHTYNIRIINLPLGRGIFVGYAQDPLCQAVESAWKAGIVVVAAAGNYGRL